MEVSRNLGVLCVVVLKIRALLFWVYIRFLENSRIYHVLYTKHHMLYIHIISGP